MRKKYYPTSVNILAEDKAEIVRLGLTYSSCVHLGLEFYKQKDAMSSRLIEAENKIARLSEKLDATNRHLWTLQDEANTKKC